MTRHPEPEHRTDPDPEPEPGADPGSNSGAGPGTSSVPRGEITRTNCRRCGHEVYGVDGRYACPLCGWVNHWSAGHTTLPTADDDRPA
ncbi:hypothetical protein ACFCV8_06475 [Streptomyces sp. NPDC056347]|uniref:hypothetical protein n=1 Tax=Streptomyces sp. NPDC056347 TaxID=3345790 RepID=UPI0035E2A2B8